MEYLEKIRLWLESADAVVINTGAGMGVDSGLADYRGDGGQWGQVEGDTGKSIFETVNPQSFLENPSYSWKLFGQRIKEYAETEPHNGFQILKDWIARYDLDYFCLTSNIDGHFQKAGFSADKIRELHGSLAYFQSSKPDSSDKIWENSQSGDVIIEAANRGIYPTCPYTNTAARPNVYMFRDSSYINTRSEEQKSRFEQFLTRYKDGQLVVFEIGSGPHVQSIRMKTRMLKSNYGANIIRINPKDYKIRSPHIGIAKGALEALAEIDNYLKVGA